MQLFYNNNRISFKIMHSGPTTRNTPKILTLTTSTTYFQCEPTTTAIELLNDVKTHTAIPSLRNHHRRNVGVLTKEINIHCNKDNAFQILATKQFHEEFLYTINCTHKKWVAGCLSISHTFNELYGGVSIHFYAQTQHTRSP